MKRIASTILILLTVMYNGKVSVKIGISMGDMNTARNIAVYEDIWQYLEKENFSVYSINADGNLAQQINDIEELAEQQVDYLIVSSLKSIGLGKTLEKVVRNGIKIIFVDQFSSDIPEEIVTSYIGLDAKAAGELCAKLFSEKIIAGNIVEIQNNTGSLKTKDVTSGFRDILCKCDNEILSVINENSDRQDIKAKLMSFMEGNDGAKLDGIFAHNDEAAMGAVYALLSGNSEKIIPIITIGGSSDVVNAIKAGYIDSCVYSSPYFGEKVLQTIENDFNGDAVDKYQIEQNMIVIDNESDFIGGY